MTTTIEFITALFCQVDDQLAGLPKHPEAHLWPSEVVTLGLLHASAGRCRGLCRYRDLLDLKVHVRIPALEDGTQLPVECSHARL